VYDLIEMTDQIKADSQRFVLSPQQWAKLRRELSLHWESVRFDVGNERNVADKRGVYAFIIENRHTALPSHGYIMYIGMTGHANERTLQKRFTSYTAEKQKAKRAGIYYMLNKWQGNVYFHFASVLDRRKSLKKLEAELCDALVPPINSNDFSAEMRPPVRAFRHA
jgi:hypothetical protein